MAVNAALINGVVVTQANTPVAAYVSPASGGGTDISSFNVANDGGLTPTYKAHIVPDGEVVGNPFVMVPDRKVKPNKTDVPYELVGQFMPPGSTLYIQSDTINELAFRASGIERESQ